MADLQTNMVKQADSTVRRLRREVLRALVDGHEGLMSRPARYRKVLQTELIEKLRAAASNIGVDAAIGSYETVSELSGVDSVQEEMAARAEHLAAFRDALAAPPRGQGPWLAAVSVTTAEVVRPETLPELRKTPEWGLMQQASIEATVSCMPPDPANWKAAEGRGRRTVEAQVSDRAAWMNVDRPAVDADEPLWSGYALREAIGSRLKHSCVRDTAQPDGGLAWRVEAEDRAYEFDYFEDWEPRVDEVIDGEDAMEVTESDMLQPTSDWWALRNGIPTAIDAFPAPNESVQQDPDVTVTLRRDVWERTRDDMGAEFIQPAMTTQSHVSIRLSAQQREDWKQRAENVFWDKYGTAEKRIELIQSQDDYTHNGGAEEISELHKASDRWESDRDALLGALDHARPDTPTTDRSTTGAVPVYTPDADVLVQVATGRRTTGAVPVYSPTPDMSASADVGLDR